MKKKLDPKYQVLLFYKYVNITDPEAVMNWQKDLCQKYDLKCRTIVAKEGINGTLEGTTENTEKFIEEIAADPRFSDIWFKRSIGTGKAFPKISVKVRSEIVTGKFGEHDVNPNQTTGKYLSADELNEWYESGKEFYVVDMRNDYEHKVGYFEDSILAPLKNFRDLPDALPKLDYLKDKPVVTVCTGGIRCEKASGVLVKNGFNNVYQLHGGIQTYMEKFPNKKFKGKLYVFDGRVTWALNEESPEHEIVAHCDKCGAVSDNYVDCANLHCKGHRHFISCENCLSEAGIAYCSLECEKAVLKVTV